ncbi:MAG: transporter substrate-binding domain-containing protein [Rhodobacteraceae bacterium]|nr:transporter substrate-binding domain-containing protein [Paracoccaceae bacterium]
MSMKTRLFGAVMAAGAALGLAVPATAQTATQALSRESVIETIKEDGVIRIGLSLFVPWSMRDVNGDLIGYELDVGRKLAADMGVEAEFVPTAWDGIIPALLAGNFDVIISGMSVTTQRNLTVNFSDPYAFTGMSVLLNTAMTEGMSLDELNDPSVTFAARRGATPVEVIMDVFPNAELLLFDEDGAAVQELLNGNAHATVTQISTVNRIAREFPDTLSTRPDVVYSPRGQAFAVRKGDPDALFFFNTWIAQQWRTGWLEERQRYWFESNEWEHLVTQ